MTLEEVHNIEGLLSEREVAKLFEVGQKTKGVILEIGSYKGKSTAALASGGAPVIAIDLWDYHPRQRRYTTARQEFNSMLVKHGLDNVIPVHADSRVAIVDYPLDVLFIDGDHSYESVKSDFERYSSNVVTGGLVLFHDYCDKSYGRGVKKFLRQVPAGFRFVELIDSLYIIKKL